MNISKIRFTLALLIVAVLIVTLALTVQFFSSTAHVGVELTDSEKQQQNALEYNTAFSLGTAQPETTKTRVVTQGQLTGTSSQSKSTPVQTNNEISVHNAIIRRNSDTTSAVTVTPEFDWLEPANAIPQILTAATRSKRNWAYGWLQLQPRKNRAHLNDQLKPLGAEIFDITGLYARARLPASDSSLQKIAKLDGIVGFGVMPENTKYRANLMSRFEALAPGEELPVFITVMTADEDSRYKEQLHAMGVTVGRWYDNIRSYGANVPASAFDDVLASDFVEEISANTSINAFLDSSVAVLGVDHLRSYSYSNGGFSSSGKIGEGIPIGVLDTGLNSLHADFANKNICAGNFVFNEFRQELDVLVDIADHGSHVSGIFAGEGKINPNLTGVAPGARDIRVAKVLNESGSGDLTMLFNSVEFMAADDPCKDAIVAAPPRVLNVSLGANEPVVNGKSLLNRKLDATIYESNQHYMIAAGNSGSDGLSDLASSKNVIAVGSISDSGVIASYSSHGPTTDLRLSPHVVAPGSLVNSVKGGGSRDEYQVYSGTSMATPATAGIVALLAGEDAAIRQSPALARAYLMATAIKPRPWIGLKTGFPENNTEGPGTLQTEYGLGLVTINGVTEDGGKVSAEITVDDEIVQPINVPEGTARLDIAVSWNEPAALVFGDTVLSNLDLYLDVDSDCQESACGEYSSESSIDNAEWLLIKDPPAGQHEIRVVTVNEFTDPAQVGLAWQIIPNDTPQLAITASASDITIDPDQSFSVDLEVSVDEFVSSGTTIHLQCRSDSSSECGNYRNGVWQHISGAEHQDGTYQEFAGKNMLYPLSIGEVSAVETSNVRITVPRGVINRSHSLYFVVTSWNGTSAMVPVDVNVSNSNRYPVPVPEHAEQPDNDNLADAIILDSQVGTVEFDLLLATREAGELMSNREPDADGGVKKFFSGTGTGYLQDEFSDSSIHNSVWYDVTSGSDSRQLTIKLSDRDTAFNVFEVSEDGYELIDHQFDIERSSVRGTVKVSGDTRYLLQVYTHSNTAKPGSMTWSFREEIESPANDDFDNATEISGVKGSITGTNYLSTLEVFEHYEGIYNESTWFKWTATDTGNFVFSSDNNNLARVVVFSGNNKLSLRRISSMPHSENSQSSTLVRVKAGEDYYIVVLSDGSGGRITDYEIAWNETSYEGYYAQNDNFASGYTLQSDSGEVSVSFRDERTVEPDEPIETGVGTLWWRWIPETSGQFTFSLFDSLIQQLSVYQGDEPESLTYLEGGTQFSVDVTAGETYHFALGVVPRSSFRDLTGTQSYTVRIVWGPTPVNDQRVNATQLPSSSDGEVSFNHQYANAGRGNVLSSIGTHSLWWKWQAPATGWYQFELQKPADETYDQRSVDNVLGVISDDVLIGTSDRSYVLNGVPKTTFYATENTNYEIQIVLREENSLDPFEDTGFSWNAAGAPAWLRYNSHFVSYGRTPGNTVADLEEFRSITIDPRSDKLYLNSITGLNQLTVSVDSAIRSVSLTNFPYVDNSGNTVSGLEDGIVHWDSNNNELYVVTDGSIFEFKEENNSRIAAKCTDLEESTLFDVVQVANDPDSSHLYVLRERYSGNSLDVFTRDEMCVFTSSQRISRSDVPALQNTDSFAFSAGSTFIYISTDDGLVTLRRNSDTSDLSLASVQNVNDRLGYSYDWEDSHLMVSSSSELVFVAGSKAPTIAVYDISQNAAEPALVDSISSYYAGLNSIYSAPPFRTTEEFPIEDRYANCLPVGLHGDGDAIDILCNDALLTVQLSTDNELAVTDMITNFKTDRFNNSLRGIRFKAGLTSNAVTSMDNNYVYFLVSDDVDTLLVFERAVNISADPY
ncbi:MAG: S8 family serine peptidase [Gammaproteobacteria bacterium]|nr:S8 family serine peptidase [Gammaproteobacteria bacterium]